MRRYALKNTLVLGIIILLVTMTAVPIITGNVVVKKSLTDTKEPYATSGNLGKNLDRNNPPVANFSYEPVEISIGDMVYFNSTSYDPDGFITNWTWDFGDGSTSNGEYVTYQYIDNGAYIVNLTVIDNESGTGFIEKTIFVGNQLPTADFTFTPDNPTTKENVYFTDTSIDPDGIIVSRWWNFGDGYYSDLQNPVHCFYSDGSYNVELIVTDNDGLVGTIQKTIIVYLPNDPPNEPYNPNPENGATGVNTKPTLGWNCSDPDDDPLNYDVYFGNTSPPPMVLSGYNDTIWSPEELDMATTYFWKIVALDDHGNSKEGPAWSFTTVIPPNDPPNAPFITGPQIVTIGQEYTFLVQSSDLQEDDVRYIFTWGDSTENTTAFGPHNTPVTLNHTWQTTPSPIMVLQLTATAEDIHGAKSGATTIWVIVSWFQSVQSSSLLVLCQKINLKTMNTNT
jgi:PKD repeat protein